MEKKINKFCVRSMGKRKLVEAILPESYQRVRFIFQSDRNDPISRMTDISPLDPDRTPGKERTPKDIDIWFPVIDIQIEPGMYAVAEITGASYCRLNSYFNLEKTAVMEGKAIFPASFLSDWENGLWIESKEAEVTSFSVVKEFCSVPSISKRAVCQFESLCEDWGGSIKVEYQDQEGQWHFYIEEKMLRKKDQVFTDLGVKTEEESLNLCIEYLLNSVNKSANNPYEGGLYLFYDCDAGTYRNGQWPWSWGTAIHFLLQCAELAESEDGEEWIHWSSEELRRAAIRIGETTLKFVIQNEDHPADGFGTTRYTPRNYSDIGYEELVNAGSDTGFLCGWGWMPLYKLTKDLHYLEAAETYLEALDKLLDQFVIPPQEWLPGKKDWTNFTIDESGFGTEGIRAVYDVTGDIKYQTLCARYMDRHLNVFERQDGLWNRQYRFDTGEIEETVYMTRGLGWAMEGLLAAYRCVPENKCYLEKAVKMAEVLLKYQRKDGSWGFVFTDEENRGGTAEKGTALWSLLLFMLYDHTKEKRHLQAAQKALRWCMDHQYIGMDPCARGGIISPSGESGVTYRAYYKLCCQYTVSFVGLALLKNRNWN